MVYSGGETQVENEKHVISVDITTWGSVFRNAHSYRVEARRIKKSDYQIDS